MPVLDKKFCRIDDTEQVRYIIEQTMDSVSVSKTKKVPRQFAIVFLSPVGKGSTGRISLCADEACKNAKPDVSKKNPNGNWSTDANTMHLLAYGKLKAL